VIIEGNRGLFSNVIGLPVEELMEQLSKLVRKGLEYGRRVQVQISSISGDTRNLFGLLRAVGVFSLFGAHRKGEFLLYVIVLGVYVKKRHRAAVLSSSDSQEISICGLTPRPAPLFFSFRLLIGFWSWGSLSSFAL
jgi:hypothetical protein